MTSSNSKSPPPTILLRVSDALTAVPLWVAFVLSRRAATRRYTYGYGRVEDLAGLFIVTVLVTAAAGATGSVAGQIARIEQVKTEFTGYDRVTDGSVVVALIIVK